MAADAAELLAGKWRVAGRVEGRHFGFGPGEGAEKERYGQKQAAKDCERSDSAHPHAVSHPRGRRNGVGARAQIGDPRPRYSRSYFLRNIS